MKITLKANPGGQFYFPKRLRDEWGNKLNLIPDMNAGVIYPAHVSAREALRSLEVVTAELEHRAEIEEKKDG